MMMMMMLFVSSLSLSASMWLDEWMSPIAEAVSVMTLVLVCVFVALVLRFRAATPIGPVTMVRNTWPLLGSTVALWKNMDNVLEYMKEETVRALEKTNGQSSTWGLSVAGMPAVGYVISDPRCVEYVLRTNFSNFVKGEKFYSRLHPLLGNGIFNVDGPAWRVQRKTSSHLFKMRELRGHMTNVFRKYGRAVLGMLSSVPKGEYIDLQDIFLKYTLDSICDIAFGLEMGMLQSTGTSNRNLRFARTFDRVQVAMEKRFYSPLWWVAGALGLPSHQRLQSDLEFLDEYAYKIIAQRRLMEHHELLQRCDLLSLFIATTDEHGKPFSDEYLRDVLMNFMLAGRDTTAQALSWTHFMLTTHPDVERKLHSEMLALLPHTTDMPDYDTARYMVYTEAIIRETLRLYPSVPKDMKFIVNDDVLPDGTRIQGNGAITYEPWVMGRLTELWGPDACEFKPERWLYDDDANGDSNYNAGGDESGGCPVQRAAFVSTIGRPRADSEQMVSSGDELNGEVEHHTIGLDRRRTRRRSSTNISDGRQTCRDALRCFSPFKFLAFNAGPRTCLGKHVALLEAKLLTAMINRQFRVTLKPGHKCVPKMSLTLPMKDGLLVSIERQ